MENMHAVFDIVSWVSLVAGAVICVIGGIGLIRLPDFYCRTHGASITDTLGAGLVLVGLFFQAFDYMFKDGVWQPDAWIIAVKIVFIGLFILFTSPTAGHALAKAAYADGVRWSDGDEGDQR